MRRLSVGLAVLLLVGIASGVAAAQDDEQYAAVEFLVLRDYNGKPVKNASVIMHPVKRNGKQKNSGLQLKTNTEGKTSFDGVPYGQLRIQVLADGFQTFGEDYTIDKAEMAITVKLKRPQGQYSVYEDHPENKTEDKKNEATPPPAKPEQKPQ
jgi:hypothetical protein